MSRFEFDPITHEPFRQEAIRSCRRRRIVARQAVLNPEGTLRMPLGSDEAPTSGRRPPCRPAAINADGVGRRDDPGSRRFRISAAIPGRS